MQGEIREWISNKYGRDGKVMEKGLKWFLKEENVFGGIRP